MGSRRFAIIAAALSGTAIVAALAIPHLFNAKNAPASLIDEQSVEEMSVAAPMSAIAEAGLQEPSQNEAPFGDIAAVAAPEFVHSDAKETVSSAETPQEGLLNRSQPLAPERQPVQIAATSADDAVHGDFNGMGTSETPLNGKAAVISPETPDECLSREACIDQYLWSVYQRTPKQDSVKMIERRKVTVKVAGKTRTVIKEFTKLVDEDFTWKDPKAAEKTGMTMMEYVIRGMDADFKLKLYHAVRAMDDAGLSPGITSAFRDDYRQSLATGLKAATDRSYHGGSFRGGYGHGLAADLVSVKGETRAERLMSSEILWKWIDAHGNEFGIGRPYLDKDPPHVAPIDGKEYADHRGTNRLHAQMELNNRNLFGARDTHGFGKPTRTAGSSSSR